MVNNVMKICKQCMNKIKNKCEAWPIISESIDEKIFGFNEWAEKNKQEFIKKHNPINRDAKQIQMASMNNNYQSFKN